MEKVAYKGWPNCIRLSNDRVDIIVTADVGPRIIRFGFLDGPNVFKEYSAMIGQTGGDEWRIYGGHRLWHAPEINPRTYHPDNVPVEIQDHGSFIRTVQQVEATTGIAKEMDISLSPSEAAVRVVHRLRNTHVWPIEIAPWSLSVMAPGGQVVIPLPPRGTHPANLLPASSLILWSFTDLADERWTWGNRCIMLRQDPTNAKPQKVGASVPDGWAAYANEGGLFIKKFAYDGAATYPDRGSVVETFTNEDMIELETLGPLVSLQPDAAVEHVEEWFLAPAVPIPATEADALRDVVPRAEAAVANA